MFSKLGEEWFDDYWINYNKITIETDDGKTKKISTLEKFVKYKNGDISEIVKRKSIKKDGENNE